MSTTIKRIALVAVAALGLGVVSVAPSSAAVAGTSYKISDATAYGFVGDTITANITLTTTAAAALSSEDSVTISAAVTKPTNASALTQESATATTSYNPAAGRWAMIDSAAASTWGSGSVVSLTNNFKLTASSTTETNTAVVVGKIAFKPVSPGTYTFAVSVDSATAALTTAPASYTGGTITIKVLSVGASSGDGVVASPYNTLNGVAGAYNYVTVKATGRDGAAVLNTKVVVSGSTFVSHNVANSTINTANNEITIPGTTAGTANAGSILVATPAVGTVTVSTFVETTPGQYSATADSVVTITVRATALSGVYSYSDVFMSTGSATPTTTTNTVAVAAATIPTASAVVSTTPVANIIVSQYDSLDVALASSKTAAVVVSISGAGVLGTTSSAAASSYIAVPAGNTTTTQANDQRFYIFPDGRTGVGTVTVTVNGVLAKTYTVKFTGTAVSYKEDADNSPSKTYIGVGETGTLSVFSYDANGVKVSATPTIYAVSETTTVATVSATGTGTVTVTGVAAGKSNITICNTAACTAATIKLVLPVEITKTSAKEGGVTLSFDKASYEPGEKIVLTVSAVDSNGRPVADGARDLFTSTGVTANVSFGGASVALPGASVDLAAGVKTYTLYAPSTAGTITVTGTEGAATALVERAAATAAGVTYVAKKATASATVTNAALDAATDAANEAAQAASDATDAALAAADAADAATTKAQEAVDAVATLSAEVSKLITALKAQITTLTNLVIKIQKKVKA